MLSLFILHYCFFCRVFIFLAIFINASKVMSFYCNILMTSLYCSLCLTIYSYSILIPFYFFFLFFHCLHHLLHLRSVYNQRLFQNTYRNPFYGIDLLVKLNFPQEKIASPPVKYSIILLISSLVILVPLLLFLIASHKQEVNQ